jgi:dihydroorotase
VSACQRLTTASATDLTTMCRGCRGEVCGVGIAPLAKGRELADLVDLPLMTHIGVGPPTIDEMIPHLRPGDILTHCYTDNNMKIVDAEGRILDRVKELHDRGLVLDIGHGAGSFSYETAERLLEQGILPDVISSDIHQLSVQPPMYDLPTTLSKFLNLGLSLAEVLERASSRPAAAMRLPHLGTLHPGSPADVALFRIDKGDVDFRDSSLVERQGSRRLTNTCTIVAGARLPQTPARKPPSWAVTSW